MYKLVLQRSVTLLQLFSEGAHVLRLLDSALVQYWFCIADSIIPANLSSFLELPFLNIS